MLDNRYHMFNCNICHTGRCSKATFKNYERIGSSVNCQLYDRPTDFKLPILVHALSNTANARPIADLLDKFGFVVQELTKYPYFILRRKTDG